MSGAKEIRTKIKSINSTRKITRAMEMVAASKMRKAQQRMLASRPYAEHIELVIEHLARSNPEYKHPYMEEREQKTVGLIVISSDRGLCGGLNANLFRKAINVMHGYKKNEIDIQVCTIGSKAASFFKRFGANVVASKTHIGDNPNVSDVIGPVTVMLKEYDEGKLDGLYLFYNNFVNTMVQKPHIQQLLPLVKEDISPEKVKARGSWDYLYEPNAKELLDLLLRRYMEMEVYQGAVENLASEQAARMVAMKSATDNAGSLIDDLKLVYNKARQAAITQELSEIVAGAAAV